MELKCLRTFRTIIDEGGFSKAAKKLNYTQSTITFQMNQLERDLSTTLFEKIGRKMVLTKAGEHLIPYVDDILQSVDKLSFLGEHLSECQGRYPDRCWRKSAMLQAPRYFKGISQAGSESPFVPALYELL